MAARRKRRDRDATGRVGTDLASRILAALDRPRRPVLSVRDVARRLGGRRGLAKAVRATLRELASDGRVERLDDGYRIARRDGLIEGSVREAGAGDRLGYAGHLVVDDAGTAWRVGVLDADEVGEGDRVLVQPIDRSGARAEIVQVLERPRRDYVGIVVHGRRGFGLASYRDDAEWLLPLRKGDLGGATAGDVVVAEPATGHGRGRGAPDGSVLRVTEVLGRPGDPEADFRAVVWRRRLPVDFSRTVTEEVDAIPDAIPRAERERRLDLCDRAFLTIDPETARDHDDAIYVEPLPGGGDRLFVGIADVSWFVPERSALDREALRRGNSVYFPSRAIPMLPERLSGDLCSLRPEVDRLALVVQMDVDGAGRVGRTRLHEAVIRSHARLSYAQAATVIDPDAVSGDAAPTGPGPDAVREQLERLAALARRLLARRVDAGALDFELPEPRVIVDETGRAVDMKRGQRTFAHRAVEEAMLAANREVARALVAAERPAIYRVHEPPAERDLDDLQTLYQSQGLLDAQPSKLGARAIASALRRAVGRPAERLVHYVTLRAMKQARYSEQNLGHFALAFEAYLHFTSPIRRYADLAVHRAVRAMIRGERAPDESAREHLQRVAVRTSARERLAMAAEREMLDLARCEVMKDRVGEIFDAVVTSTAPHGLYVVIDDPYVEGLLPVGELSGWYTLDERSHALVDRDTQHRYALGDALRLRLERVDPIKGWINFALASRRKAPVSRSGRPTRKARRKGAPRKRRARR